MSYHQQVLYLSDQTGTPSEIFNAARLSRNLVTANLCGSKFDNVITNGGCDGLLYQPNLPSALSDPVLYLDAADGAPAQQRVSNRGSGGSLLDGIYGATTASSTDDPVWLGGAEPYVYLPGLTGNTLSVPDATNLRITGDIEIILKVSADDWQPSAAMTLLSKYVAGAQGYEVSLGTDGSITFRCRLAAATVTANSFAGTFQLLNDGQATWMRITRVSSTGVVSFYSAPATEDLPVSWVSMVAPVTSTTGAMATGSAVLYVGATAGTTTPFAGKIHRSIVRSEIGVAASAVLDVDCSTLTSQASILASTGQTATINRASSGRKSVAYVGRPLWLFGTDDVITIADTSDLLDFGSGESFTVMTLSRRHGTPADVQAIISKKATIGTASASFPSPSGFPSGALYPGIADGAGASGWWISDRTDNTTSVQISDGTLATSSSSLAKTSGVVYAEALARDALTPLIYSYQNGAATVAAGLATSVANSTAVMIGRAGDGSLDYDGEVMAALVWRRLLSASEIIAVEAYLSGAAALTGSCWSPVDFASHPWDDGSSAADEALGFWIEEWTGLDGAHHTRTTAGTGPNRGGARYGPQSSNARVMKLNVLLHGTTERGLEYLFRWLEQTLIDACDPCGSRTAWWREFCPSAPTTSPEEGYLRAEKIALLEGPTWETPPAVDAGCYIRRVSFTLGAGDPCLYREVTPLITQVSTTFQSSISTNMGIASCGSWFAFGSSMHTQVDVPTVSYGRSAPVILITSPYEVAALPALRIMGYSDPNGTSDPCRSRLLGELILEGVDTAGKDIEIDMAGRRVRVRDRYAGGDWEDGSRYIAPAINSGLRRWWSFDGCTTGFVVVEPVYLGLATNRYQPSLTRVSSWTVSVSAGARIGCA